MFRVARRVCVLQSFGVYQQSHTVVRSAMVCDFGKLASMYKSMSSFFQVISYILLFICTVHAISHVGCFWFSLFSSNIFSAPCMVIQVFSFQGHSHGPHGHPNSPSKLRSAEMRDTEQVGSLILSNKEGLLCYHRVLYVYTCPIPTPTHPRPMKDTVPFAEICKFCVLAVSCWVRCSNNAEFVDHYNHKLLY